VVTYAFLTNLKTGSVKTDLPAAGMLGVTLSVLSEYIFDHYVMGISLDTILADYNILKARV